MRTLHVVAAKDGFGECGQPVWLQHAAKLKGGCVQRIRQAMQDFTTEDHIKRLGREGKVFAGAENSGDRVFDSVLARHEALAFDGGLGNIEGPDFRTFQSQNDGHVAVATAVTKDFFPETSPTSSSILSSGYKA